MAEKEEEEEEEEEEDSYVRVPSSCELGITMKVVQM
jgi:hypothetical protein